MEKVFAAVRPALASRSVIHHETHLLRLQLLLKPIPLFFFLAQKPAVVGLILLPFATE